MFFAAKAKATKETIAERPPFAGFATDEESREAITQAAGDRGWRTAVIEEGDLASAIGHLSEAASPELLLVDLGPVHDPVEAMQALEDAMHSLESVCEPNTHVVAVGDINDVAFFRALTEFGIDDYLLKPLTVEILQESFDRVLHDPSQEAVSSDLGRMIAVTGTRGGVGATTVAVNVAWALSHNHKLRTVIVDLDLHFGTVALALDVEATRGLSEALTNSDRIDTLFIDRATIKASDSLSVLGSEEPLDDSEVFDTDALNTLIDSLRDTYEVVVLDLPRDGVAYSRDLLAKAGTVLLVTDLSLAALRDTIRLKSVLGAMAREADLKVIANNVGRRSQLTQEEFEDAAEGPLDVLIPFEQHQVSESGDAGRPVVTEDGKAAAALTQLAKMITQPEAEEEEKESFWKQFFG